MPPEPAAPGGCLVPDLAVVEHEYLIGVQNGTESMRHDDARPAGHQLSDRPLDLCLGLRIDRARGLVEHEKSGIESQGPREAQ